LWKPESHPPPVIVGWVLSESHFHHTGVVEVSLKLNLIRKVIAGRIVRAS
jgi:hypothetical protein